MFRQRIERRLFRVEADDGAGGAAFGGFEAQLGDGSAVVLGDGRARPQREGARIPIGDIADIGESDAGIFLLEAIDGDAGAPRARLLRGLDRLGDEAAGQEPRAIGLGIPLAEADAARRLGGIAANEIFLDEALLPPGEAAAQACGGLADLQRRIGAERDRDAGGGERGHDMRLAQGARAEHGGAFGRIAGVERRLLGIAQARIFGNEPRLARRERRHGEPSRMWVGLSERAQNDAR